MQVRLDLRAEAQALLGRQRRVVAVEPLSAQEGSVVSRVHLADAGPSLVLETGQGADHDRTAAVVALARDAGVPVPAVVARGPSPVHPRWHCVLSEHADGTPGGTCRQASLRRR